MPKPDVSKIPEFYQRYVKAVNSDELIPALKSGRDKILTFLTSVPDSKEDFRYADGKWSVKEVINHMMDAERVFAYRALTFSRNDSTELPGFDENSWAPQTNLVGRSLSNLLTEYSNLRASTIDLFRSFNDAMLNRSGVASGVKMDVATLGFLIAGHEQHHYSILKDRYFSN